jgi:hypothetical protein
VVLGGNPFEDITAVYDVARVFRDGREVVDDGRLVGTCDEEVRP